MGSAVAGLTAVVPTAAVAAPPTDKGGHREAFAADSTYTAFELCPFPVEIRSRAEGFIVRVETARGTLVRVHFKNYDVFTANGVSLTSDTYTGNNHLLIGADGIPISATASGVFVRVPLPDGSTFMAAGGADFASTSDFFISTPEHGMVRNRDAFCSVLAG